MLNVPAGFEVPEEVANKAIPLRLRGIYKKYQVRPELIEQIMANHVPHVNAAAVKFAQEFGRHGISLDIQLEKTMSLSDAENGHTGLKSGLNLG